MHEERRLNSFLHFDKATLNCDQVDLLAGFRYFHETKEVLEIARDRARTVVHAASKRMLKHCAQSSARSKMSEVMGDGLFGRQEASGGWQW